MSYLCALPDSVAQASHKKSPLGGRVRLGCESETRRRNTFNFFEPDSDSDSDINDKSSSLLLCDVHWQSRPSSIGTAECSLRLRVRLGLAGHLHSESASG